MKNIMKFEIDNELLSQTIISGLKEQIRDEVTKRIDNEVKSGIQKIFTDNVDNSIGLYIKDLLLEFFNNQEVKVSVSKGMFNEEIETKTLNEVIKEKIGKVIELGEFRVDGRNKKILEHLSTSIIDYKIESLMKEEITKARREVNANLKNSFETKLQSMLSNIAYDTLKTNSYYKEISSKLGISLNKE